MHGRHKRGNKGYKAPKKTGKRKLSPQAEAYISRHIEIERNAGYPEKQAVAISYSKARRAGYKIPKRKLRAIS